MESEIGMLEEVVHVKACSSKEENVPKGCSDINCVKKKVDELEIERLLYNQQELKAELADLFRSKEKYKRLFKQLKQENEQLRTELNGYKSREHLESNKATSCENSINEDAFQQSSPSECDEQQLSTTIKPHKDGFNHFLQTSPHQNFSDLPPPAFLKEPETSYENKDQDLGIDPRCFQGVYTSQKFHILETKFQESSVLSKEVQEECCRLTNLSKPQIIKWFHMRRPNTKRIKRFNPHVLSYFRLFYTHNRFPNYEEREMLAEKTNLSNFQVRNWFKKQREKEKKQKKTQKATAAWYKLLEKSFNENMYTSQEEIEALEHQTTLSKEQIEQWFQNRRKVAEQITRSVANNRTATEDSDFVSPLVCSPSSLQDIMNNQNVEKPDCKQELNDEPEDSVVAHNIPYDGGSSSSSTHNLLRMASELNENAQVIDNEMEQKSVPVFSQAALNRFSALKQ